MTPDTSAPRDIVVHQFGEFSVLIDTPTGVAADLSEAARRCFGDTLVQAVPTTDCLLLTFAAPTRSSAVRGTVTGLAANLLNPSTDASSAPGNQARDRPPTRVATSLIHTIDVHYDGADLSLVADRLGVEPTQVVAWHTGATFRVEFFGFAPGFAYLAGLPDQLHLPRRDTPRTSVPPGSVAIASTYSAVYPRASPGGWHLIGRTDAVMFDPRRDPPALLTPGARVRFRPV